MDILTGMKNRTAFMEEQERDIQAIGRTYILMDINNLKFINDMYGHQAGDRLIVTAAEYIGDTFGKMGECYRIGGDEFVVILRKCTSGEAANALFRMQELIEKDNKRRKIPLSIAAGYAVQECEEDTADRLFRQADANMYVEKQRMKENSDHR